jgi:DNA-binding transcriptional regulator LsrR (DeoR family)
MTALSGDPKKLLYELAKAYYEDGLAQSQIGKRFGWSLLG